MTIKNRLNQETSPYLLQHADNPVHWQPWDETALKLAEQHNKPILLSIGYSACHWCHVMAHESFEDTPTAALMNALFINIKVDREERPDIDKIYQLAHAAITQKSGGWPLTMFLTPDRMPFFGGTYFPLQPRYGMPAFQDILQRVADYFNQQSHQIQQQNQSLQQFFATLNAPSQDTKLNESLAEAIFKQMQKDLISQFDAVNGGFGQAPKFPHTPSIEQALRQWYRSAKQDNQSLHMVEFTLDKMASGGIYDHLGGGFFRYSVDQQWMIPHFEKMLYDNGPLLSLYARVWVCRRHNHFKQTATETAEWVMREMQSDEGGYFATLDADSEGVEGKYYVWDQADVKQHLNTEDYTVFAHRYGLNNAANFEGAWHLYINQPNSSDAVAVNSAKEALFKLRQQRIRPARDEKILPAWNGLMIKGMAQAGRYLGDARYTASAAKALGFIFKHMLKQNRLLASYKDGAAKYPAYVDDYAFLLDGILELLQSQWNHLHLHYATQLAEILLTHFEDPNHGGFYFTADDHEQLLYRPKSNTDESMPSGAALAAYALNRLGYLLGESNYIQAAERAVISIQSELAQSPLGHCSYLSALDEIIHPPTLYILRCKPKAMKQWEAVSSAYYHPNGMLFIIPHDDSDTPLHPNIASKQLHDGESCLYLCQGYQCAPPICDEAEIKDALLTAR